MEAIKLSIGFREWSKLPDFVEMINGEEEEFIAYEIDNTTALIVADHHEDIEWVKLKAAMWFEDQYTETISK